MIDSHVHVIDPLFARPEGPGYTPRPGETATRQELAAVLAGSGIEHAVVVQLSGFGTDNHCILDAVKGSAGAWRAVVSLAPDVADRELDALDAMGAVGIRFNISEHGSGGISEHGRLLSAIGERGWVVQVQCPAAALPTIAPFIEVARGPVIFDHLGRPDVEAGVNCPGFQWLLDFARRGERAIVKLSGGFRVSRRPFPYNDLNPFIDALLGAFPRDRRIWGSDWPFVATNAMPTYEQTLALLERWLPDEQDRRWCQIDTPARLFRFDEPAEAR